MQEAAVRLFDAATVSNPQISRSRYKLSVSKVPLVTKELSLRDL